MVIYLIHLSKSLDNIVDSSLDLSGFMPTRGTVADYLTYSEVRATPPYFLCLTYDNNSLVTLGLNPFNSIRFKS